VHRPLPHPGLVTRGTASASPADVVVHRGDTLWDIARRDLGTDATDAEVAHAWPAWHEANLAVIGDDPDLLLPGQILRRPPSPSLAARLSGAER
jgi:nucleoid-associated protein YgaU